MKVNPRVDVSNHRNGWSVAAATRTATDRATEKKFARHKNIQVKRYISRRRRHHNNNKIALGPVARARAPTKDNQKRDTELAAAASSVSRNALSSSVGASSMFPALCRAAGSERLCKSGLLRLRRPSVSRFLNARTANAATETNDCGRPASRSVGGCPPRSVGRFGIWLRGKLLRGRI